MQSCSRVCESWPIGFHELPPLGLAEAGAGALDTLWRRGGFPRSFTARTEEESCDWRRNFIRTFLERDLPQLGVRVSAETLRRFWVMLAHYHGQTFNYMEFARAFGVADTTVRRYLDSLASTFVLHVLAPYSANLSKRQVKAPRVYVADSGLLHSLLDIESQRDLERHPKLGASWEGFLMANVARQLGARRDQCFYWATHAGAELDLLVVQGARRIGFEFKRTTSPVVTPSMRVALSDLRLQRLDVVHAGNETFPLSPRIRAVAARRILADLP